MFVCNPCGLNVFCTTTTTTTTAVGPTWKKGEHQIQASHTRTWRNEPVCLQPDSDMKLSCGDLGGTGRGGGWLPYVYVVARRTHNVKHYYFFFLNYYYLFAFAILQAVTNRPLHPPIYRAIYICQYTTRQQQRKVKHIFICHCIWVIILWSSIIGKELGHQHSSS